MPRGVCQPMACAHVAGQRLQLAIQMRRAAKICDLHLPNRHHNRFARLDTSQSSALPGGQC